MLLEYIPQRGDNDCGVACLAMLARISYKQALKNLPEWPRTQNTTKKNMTDALRALGMHADDAKAIGKRSFRDFEFDAALLGYWKRGKYKILHWVMWNAKEQKDFDPDDPMISPHIFKCTSYIKVRKL